MFLDCFHYCVVYTLVLLSLGVQSTRCLDKTSGYLNRLTHLMITLCLVSLIACFMSSQFAFATIFAHSNAITPLLYQIAATWSNHEGSLLLWCWLCCCCNVPVAFLAVFLVITSNCCLKNQFVCFNSIAELNPVLQDPVLAIHPPCIYSGYAASAVCFCVCFRHKSVEWSHFWLTLRVWSGVCWFWLTIGIFLGSWWAYHELGWGGWWFWDPVENASLMPWLMATACIHCVLFPRLNSWTLFATYSLFFLSVLGTFLVRSGLLASVHSFASDSTRGVFLLAFCLGILFLSSLKWWVSNGT
jgi:cytochrome c-type biogenesis protein CcmF